MEKALKVVNALKKKGIVKNYAVGGGIAALFYIEPVLTYDLDILFIPSESKHKLAVLSPVYECLKKMGYMPYQEHIMIEGIPTQFIPAYNELTEEAVKHAKKTKYKNETAKVLRAEYVFAIMLQTGRPKDKERMAKIFMESRINKAILASIVKNHGLETEFDKFLRRKNEK